MMFGSERPSLDEQIKLKGGGRLAQCRIILALVIIAWVTTSRFRVSIPLILQQISSSCSCSMSLGLSKCERKFRFALNACFILCTYHHQKG